MLIYIKEEKSEVCVLIAVEIRQIKIMHYVPNAGRKAESQQQTVERKSPNKGNAEHAATNSRKIGNALNAKREGKKYLK